MTYSIQYSLIAERDIDRATNYIMHNLKNPLAAHRLQLQEISSVKNLLHFPFKYPLIDDLLLAPYKIRYLPVNNYMLFYTIIEETKTIYIVRFLYSRSDWKRILKHYVQYDEYLTGFTCGYVHEEQEKYGKQFKKEHNNMPETQNTNIDSENFDEEKARQELFNELQKGLDDIKAGRTVPAEEVFAMLREELEK